MYNIDNTETPSVDHVLIKNIQTTNSIVYIEWPISIIN